jgi:hypothetical protein
MSHYSFGQKPYKLVEWSLLMANEIKKTFNDGKLFPVLIYSGMSGISLCTAVANSFYSLYEENLYMAYVRKDGERSHGSIIEWEYLHKFSFLDVDNDCKPMTFFCLPKDIKTGCRLPICLIFVDDFVSSGETLMRCVREFKKGINGRSDVQFKTKKVLLCLGREVVLRDYTEIATMDSKEPILQLLREGTEKEVEITAIEEKEIVVNE